MGARKCVPLEVASQQHIKRQGTGVAFYERKAFRRSAINPRY